MKRNWGLSFRGGHSKILWNKPSWPALIFWTFDMGTFLMLCNSTSTCLSNKIKSGHSIFVRLWINTRCWQVMAACTVGGRRADHSMCFLLQKWMKFCLIVIFQDHSNMKCSNIAHLIRYFGYDCKNHMFFWLTNKHIEWSTCLSL